MKKDNFMQDRFSVGQNMSNEEYIRIFNKCPVCKRDLTVFLDKRLACIFHNQTIYNSDGTINEKT